MIWVETRLMQEMFAGQFPKMPLQIFNTLSNTLLKIICSQLIEKYRFQKLKMLIFFSS